MVQETFVGLINNISLLLVLVVLYNLFPLKRIIGNLFFEKILSGISLGVIGIFLIMNPWEIREGVLFDARTIFIGLSALFFGPIPSVILVLMTSLYRFSVGGIATWMGIATIITSAGIGLVWRMADHKSPDEYKFKELFLLGLLLHIFPTLYLVMLPKEIALQILSRISLMIVAIYPFATAILGKILAHQHKQFKMEQALIESEKSVRQILENMPVMMNALDENKYFAVWNRESERITGYHADEIIENPHAIELLYPDSDYREQMLGEFSDLGADFRNKESRITCKDGSERLISWSDISKRFPTKGLFIWSIGVDVTERRLAEAALKKSEKRFRSLIELSPLGVGIINTEGIVVDSNQALASMLGYTIEELSGMDIKDITHPDDSLREKKLIESLVNNEMESFSMEKRYRHKNGNYFWINIAVSKMFDSFDAGIYIFGFVEDISKRKQMELEREELIKELQKALTENKELRGILPICSNCKKIRDDQGYWNQLESYFAKHSDAQFSHGICPDCAKKLYQDLYKEISNGKKIGS